MLKTRKKWLSILLTVAMLVGLMVPFAGPAIAGTSYYAVDVPTIQNDGLRTLGKLGVKIDPMPANTTAQALITLPNDFDVVTDTVYSIEWAAQPNGATAQLTYIDENTLKLTVTTTTYSGKAELFVAFENVDVSDSAEGDVAVTIDGISGPLPDGKVVIAKVVSDGALEVSVIEDDEFTDDGGRVKIRVEENVAGTLNGGDELKLVLPGGLEWGTVSGLNVLWGDLTSSDIQINPDEDELIIKTDGSESQEAIGFEFWVDINIDDEDEADYGDVTVKVKGDYDVTPSEIVVGQYADYSVTVEADDPDTKVYAGLNEQDISDITIKEGLEGSLDDGKTIKLTLPSNARWVMFGGKYVAPNPPSDDSNFWQEGEVVVSDNGVELIYAGLEGTDDRTLKLEVQNESTDAAELTIEDNQVALEAGVTGDLKIKISGTQDIETEEITVAKIVSPVSVKVEKTTVLIGKSGQAAGNITITEEAAEAIDADGELRITLPEDVTFDGTPDVEVTSGDLEIDDVDVDEDDDDNDVLVITFSDESTEPSTIVISGIKYNVDRTVTEGDIEVEIGGSAIVETDHTAYYDGSDFDVESGGFEDDDEAFFEDTDYAVKVVNAEVVSAIQTKRSATFQINSTTYSVNGIQATMDVAPYIKDGRTYLPTRYVAYALGISPENIIWDGVKATFIGQGRVVQVTPGSAIMAINGAPITMDVVAEVVNGRVMVPFRWVAQAFGAQVDWNEADQTVSMTL
ncbi:hypothetical protein MGLY_10750 [Neomoorella glycerini]|uniref:Copper amine oxidase-like N-terminal domain-containing protein n=1 Tax=Neomoorella glycerini TaxID=55779 RepID=A0A6I5ZP87_9FIRM|nr:copper amine oxidase N-terminal domain-containing protein [Moorella glycerini]QGP91733.1 hypothetical protein MGLY_10750 [Moorella glycerini]